MEDGVSGLLSSVLFRLLGSLNKATEDPLPFCLWFGCCPPVTYNHGLVTLQMVELVFCYCLLA
jgi:hypothetical protein